MTDKKSINKKRKEDDEEEVEEEEAEEEEEEKGKEKGVDEKAKGKEKLLFYSCSMIVRYKNECTDMLTKKYYRGVLCSSFNSPRKSIRKTSFIYIRFKAKSG